MKGLIIGATAFALSFTPFAKVTVNLGEDGLTKEEVAICYSQREIARTVMEGRQEGFPMSTMLQIAGEHGDVVSLIREAYRIKDRQNPYNELKEVCSFADKAEKDCRDIYD